MGFLDDMRALRDLTREVEDVYGKLQRSGYDHPLAVAVPIAYKRATDVMQELPAPVVGMTTQFLRHRMPGLDEYFVHGEHLHELASIRSAVNRLFLDAADEEHSEGGGI
jgi:hypothetical protein